MRPPFPLTAEIAPGADPNASPSTWAFTSDGVRYRAKVGMQFTAGRDDEDDETKPGSAEMTLDDRDGNLSPRNVMGKWYGDLRRNTPLRAMLDTFTDTFTRSGSGWGTEPTSGYTWEHAGTGTFSTNGSAAVYSNSTTNTAAYAFVGGNVGSEVDIYHSASISATPTGSSWVHATVLRRDADGRHYRAYTEFATDGTVKLKITRFVGATTELTGLISTGVAFSPGTTVHTHVRAIGKTIQARVWTGSIEPDTWQASVDDSQVLGAGCGLYEWRIANNAGALVLTVDNYRVRTSLWTGQVPSWPVRWPEKSGTDCVATVSAAGIFRWLGQAQPPLTDPISQQLSAYNPMGYWPLQDGSDAKAGGSARPRSAPASVLEGTFGNDDAPPGALSSLALNTANVSRLSASVSGWNIPRDGYSVMAYFRFPTLPPASPARTLMTITAPGSVGKWLVTVDAATISLTGYDQSNVEVTTTNGQTWTIDPTAWYAVQIETEADEVANTVDYAMIWHQVGSEAFYAAGGTYSGIVNNVSQVTVNAAVDGMLVSHLWVGRHTLPFVDDAFMQVSAGYAGELDTDRVARVLGDAGIEVLVQRGAGVQLGPQPRNATALEVVRDAEKAGWGTLYEYGAILAYLPYDSRINPPVAMALDWAEGHMADAPEPEDDDLNLINRWTSRRPNGSERTAEDAASIAENRVYADGDEANVYTDEQLSDDASWHVALGARGVMRWPRIEIDLTRNPSLISPWLACREGSRITIANLPSQVAGEVADLIIVGYEQHIRQHRWRVTLTCVPAAPWTEVGTWGTARGSSSTTVLNEAVDATETAIDVRSSYIEHTWYSPATVGEQYVIDMDGEPVTVTAATAPAGSAGAFTQTLTVVRHPTLARSHPTGRRVRLRTGVARWSLGR